MRRFLTLLSMVFLTVAGTVVIAQPALAHGYVSAPPSRQAHCAAGRVANCGPIIYEPQSVEGPKGQRNCHAGDPRWAPLNDDSKAWPVTGVGTSVTFTWTFTARHATRDYEYYIGGTRVGYFSGGGAQPPPTVSHTLNLSGFSGRQKILAIWNIADTAMAFYSCVDVNVGGGGSTPSPSPSPSPTPTQTTPPGGTWAPNVSYAVGATVTYGGATYRCRQAHTSLNGWEPPNAPALWQRL
ncbi:lytic polysaccharide monooxygenase [Thermoactinospora rubra]|uniref:lytic polysaccharide monooxygenase n=1 Tax=Thermoactinospora rubra TaxID=1088767 RepID=UPI000A114CCB|nr:lytic polysaccharide monooxygenase [Thermoactinospora rubra]